jgi:hypothetical protein
MQIWDESIRSNPIFDGSTLIIGSFDGAELMLNGHNPFLRCLSYHAFQAWNHYDGKLGGAVPRDPPVNFRAPVGNLYVTNHEAAMKIAAAEDSESEDELEFSGSDSDAFDD